MTILGTTVANADARFVRSVGQPEDAGFKLVRGWPWLAGYSDTGTDNIQDLLEGLTATSVTTPQANGNPYAGKFVISENRGFDENEDGTAARDCKIIQELTRVKTTATLVGLGTPSKDADRATMNFLGYQEGEKWRIYYTYRNLDPANRATIMSLTLAVETGYTITKREFLTEKDKTGTLRVTYEKDYWPTTNDARGWVDDRVRKGYTNYSSDTQHGFAENKELTGLDKQEVAPVFLSAQTADTNRVVSSLRQAERADGEYVVQQNQRVSFAGTAAGDALIARIRSSFGSQTPAMTRIWWRRNDTARTALIDTNGTARSSFVFESDTYFHNEVSVQDNGDNTFTVTQDLLNILPSISTGATYYTDSYLIDKVFTRSKDNKTKTIYYWKFVSAKGSEASAVSYIKNKVTTTRGIVPGSDHVVKKGVFFYVATCLRISADGDYLPGDAPKVAIRDWE